MSTKDRVRDLRFRVACCRCHNTREVAPTLWSYQLLYECPSCGTWLTAQEITAFGARIGRSQSVPATVQEALGRGRVTPLRSTCG
jgi:hypothetical protein